MSSNARRLERLEDIYLDGGEEWNAPRIRQLAEQIAADEDITVDELITGAQQLADAFEREVGGPHTLERLAAYVAETEGVPVEQVLAGCAETRMRYR